MLAAQSDKALLNVYNFQKACISRRDRLPATDYRPTGPDRPKGGSAGKIDLSDSGSKVKILRRWYRSGTDIPLGGAFRFIFQCVPHVMTRWIVGRLGHTLPFLGRSLSPSERAKFYLRRNDIGICQ